MAIPPIGDPDDPDAGTGDQADPVDPGRATGAEAGPGTPRVVVALLAASAVSAATLFGFHDLLAGTRRDWQMLHGAMRDRRRGPADDASPFEPVIVSRDGQPLDVANGVRVTPRHGFATCPRPAVVCVTDLLVAPDDDLTARFAPEVDWLRACHAHGAVIATACSGALLLARTGLLAGCDATSHWAYCRALARQYPDVRWDPARGFVRAGRDGRLLMAGSGTAWQWLALALIARYAGADEAMRVARINLIDGPDAAPLAFASLVHGPVSDDRVVADCQRWAVDHFAEPTPVAAMVRRSGLAERTFHRRFGRAVGLAPIDWIHRLRLEAAKRWLETTGLPVDEIAARVGYRDPAYFSRLFRREVAVTPASWRRRFGGLKRRLEPFERAGADDPAPG